MFQNNIGTGVGSSYISKQVSSKDGPRGRAVKFWIFSDRFEIKIRDWACESGDGTETGKICSKQETETDFKQKSSKICFCLKIKNRKLENLLFLFESVRA